MSDHYELDLVALDFPGHGKSTHKSADAPPNKIVSEFVHYVAEAVAALGWDDGTNQDDESIDDCNGFDVIGHSMGGIVAVMYAASFPERVRKLILLDSYGPDDQPPETISSRIQRNTVERFQYNRHPRQDERRRVYHSLRAAVATREWTARLSPGGHQWLSEEAARELVRWSTIPAMDGRERGNNSPSNNDCTSNDNGPVQFIHDPRFKQHPLMVHVLEHIDAYWQSLQCPVLCLNAHDGWPFPRTLVDRAYGQVQQRQQRKQQQQRRPNGAVCNDCINEAMSGGPSLTSRVLPGSHCFHADPEHADAVIKAILGFLISPEVEEIKDTNHWAT